MTPIQACKETKELWTEMARIAREEKRIIAKSEVPGPWQAYKCNCPCCEYAEYYGCYYCPMSKEWEVYSTISFLRHPSDDHVICADPRSPYRQWSYISHQGSLCIDVEFFCLLIAEMAEEAIERLIAESQPKMAEDKDIEYVEVNKEKNK